MKVPKRTLCVLLGAHLLGGTLVASESPDVEGELEEAKALYREARLAETVAKLRGVIAQLERLRELQIRREALADACLGLALSYVASGDPGAAIRPLEAVVLLDKDRRLDRQVYGPQVVALFEEARAARASRSDLAGTRGRSVPAAHGSLSVASDTWLEVTIDGGPPEDTPLFLPRLAVGRHTVRASRPGRKSQVVEVEVREGDTTSLKIDLERLREPE